MSQLQARGLSKRFVTAGVAQLAVDDFSVEVNPGEVVAIVGESGSGKSTVARMILGLEVPTAGEVRVLDASGSRKPTLQDVQMVFQDPFASLNPVHRVRTHLYRPMRRLTQAPAATLPERSASLLERVGLTPPELFLDRFPGSLSGGQRQRVAIARALAANPRFVVADEPTSMLDVSIRRGVLQLLRELAAAGVGVVLITHDLKSVEQVADRVHVLRRGRCVEAGATAAVLGDPQHEYTKLLVSSVPDPDGLFLA